MKTYPTSIKDFVIRTADANDVNLILEFIKKLALYEHLENQVVATSESLKKSIFNDKRAEVIIAEYQDKPIGFALYFFNYSTFLGKANLFLEDLFIDEKYRGNGFGRMMFKQIAKIALENQCSRLDFMCLNWNQSSLKFYDTLGAKVLSDWNVLRLEEKELEILSKVS